MKKALGILVALPLVLANTALAGSASSLSISNTPALESLRASSDAGESNEAAAASIAIAFFVVAGVVAGVAATEKPDSP